MDPRCGRRARHRTRGVTLALGLALLLVAAPIAPTPPAVAHDGTFHGNAKKVCRIDWRDGPEKVARLIRCAARTWPVPGGPDYAVMVARCESGLDPGTVYYGHYGVFQHMLEYWPARATAYGFDGASPLNGRANIIVSIRMVHVGGWGPWSCAR
jgi:hypothetical protein